MAKNVRAVGYASAVLALILATPALADGPRYVYSNTYGLPGLIDMPSADAYPDADLRLTVSGASDGFRSTLAFQVFEGVTATFRYSGLDLELSGPDRPLFYDRSFDVHWQLWEQRGWIPAVAVGIRDIAGTGIFGGEYVVATQRFGSEDQVAVTVGLGWGRLAERGGFANPLGVIDDRFETRPGRDFGQGGTVTFDQFFRGDAALFGGVSWQIDDQWSVQAEYSTDPYTRAQRDGVIDVASAFNFGVNYRFSEGTVATAYVLQGDLIGVSLNFAVNPYRSPVIPGALDTPPRPLAVRAPQSTPYDTGWVNQPGGAEVLRDNFAQLFEDQGLALDHLALDAQRAVIRVRNTGYDHEAQALGRVLRAMSAALPPSVEVFEVIFVVEGVDTTRIRVSRTDLELTEFDPGGAEILLAVAEVEDALRVDDPHGIEVFNPAPSFTWGIGPYSETSLFNPDNPFLFDLGVELEARYRFGGGFVLGGSVRIPVVGTLDEASLVAAPQPNGPPVVRSNSALYLAEGGAYLRNLTFSHFGRPFENVYSRVSIGYLERMYAGISGELLWQPAASRLGIGLEVNHVWARDFDGGFGLRDYDVTTGHVSVYYALTDEFDVQIDAGRYLAGDWGATFRLDRRFDNGWRVGAFATFTDVSFEAFGEGSFDKGIQLEIPLSWFTGNSDRASQATTIRPILRDGGARLSVQGRLHDLIYDYTRPSLEETEAMVWR